MVQEAVQRRSGHKYQIWVCIIYEALTLEKKAFQD